MDMGLNGVRGKYPKKKLSPSENYVPIVSVRISMLYHWQISLSAFLSICLLVNRPSHTVISTNDW